MCPQRSFRGGIEDADLLWRTLPGGEAPRPPRLLFGDDTGPAMLRDPHGRPLTEAGFVVRRPLPPVRTLREALALSREAFAARFQIPLETLADWEAGMSEPDPLARAYLTVIARNPDAVRDALETAVSVA